VVVVETETETETIMIHTMAQDETTLALIIMTGLLPVMHMVFDKHHMHFPTKDA